MTVLALLAVFSPLLGALLAGFLPTILKDKGCEFVTCALMGVACVAATLLFVDVGLNHQTAQIPLFTWMKVGTFDVAWGIQLDTLSVVMLAVVTFVSLMVHVYSVGYMHHDNSIPRFMSYLSLFTFFMLMLVTSPNLVQMFFGWEGVGVASYLLIGFWYERPSAGAAAIKAFLVNRVGDIGFALGIFTLFALFGSVEFGSVFEGMSGKTTATFSFLGYEFHALTLASLLLFIGAMGKSAQLGLHTWLPDAMEGPTPVSALIHAATMVTAGVFMVVRLSPLLEYAPFARDVITVVGALTALFAATVACTQNDIKRVIAYSTCSQLGYMFMAAGISAYGASMFHLTTHAFFKAMLFLGAGSVIHAMSDEQDMRKMGGLWKLIPATYIIMWIGNLALAGIPFFAGYYSKDVLLEALWASNNPVGQMAYVVGIAAACLTAFYSWRLLLMTFHGKPHGDEIVMSHVHESPSVMLIPLGLLAVGAIFSGALLYGYFVGEGYGAFWGNAIFVLPANNSLEAAHHVESWVKLTPTIAGVAGIILAYVMYQFVKSLPQILASVFKPVYNFLLNKWYFDELYEAVFVKPSLWIGKILWLEGDKAIIDGLGPDGMAKISMAGSGVLCRLQSGYLYHYAFAMILGLVGFIGWFVWKII